MKIHYDMLEVIFAYFFKKFDRSRIKSVYFIEVTAQHNSFPLEGDFFARFSKYNLQVKPISACISSGKDRVFDKEPRERGIIFRIVNIQRVNTMEFCIRGGFYSHGRAAATQQLQVVLEHEEWIIKSDKLISVS
ncbi:MAG: hypothetical protein AAGF95_09025 [Chloroflexota bacterium]